MYRINAKVKALGTAALGLLTCGIATWFASDAVNAKEPVNPSWRGDTEQGMKWCKSDNIMLLGSCDATIQSVYEVGHYTHAICPPRAAWDASRNDRFQVIFPFAEQHPELWDDGFAVLVMRAYQAKWPCK